MYFPPKIIINGILFIFFCHSTAAAAAAQSHCINMIHLCRILTENLNIIIFQLFKNTDERNAIIQSGAETSPEVGWDSGSPWQWSNPSCSTRARPGPGAHFQVDSSMWRIGQSLAKLLKLECYSMWARSGPFVFDLTIILYMGQTQAMEPGVYWARRNEHVARVWAIWVVTGINEPVKTTAVLLNPLRINMVLMYLNTDTLSINSVY